MGWTCLFLFFLFLLANFSTSYTHTPNFLDAEQPFWTKFREGFYLDGGLVDLVPPVPGAIKVGM